MCKSTKGTQAASAGNAVRDIQPNTAGGGGTPPPPANAFGGFQEHVPDAVFTSTAGTQAFLQSANRFYTFFGLQPQDIASIEALVILLANPANTTTYRRLLLVSHAHPRGMIIPFFTGGVNGTNKEVFRGFAKSDLDGLKMLNPFDPPIFLWDSVFSVVMDNVRANAAAAPALTPFGLQSSGSPGGDLREFFKQCFDYVFINTPGRIKNNANANITAGQRTICTRFIGEIINQIGKKVVGTSVNSHTVTQPEIDALKTALTHLTINDLNVGTHTYALSGFGPDNMNYYPTLDNAARAVHDGFHNKIVQMRQRLTPTSAIDIRGCRAGDDPDYLTAMREFFDRPNDPRLTASGPRWYQSYPPLGWQRPANRNDISNYLSHRIFSNTVAHDEQMAGARAWAALIKVDPLHTTFWSTLFGGPPAAFISLSWRSNIPALFIPTPGLAALNGLSLADVIAKLADLFNVPAASVPSASQITSANAAAMQTFMTAAKGSLETGDGIYYYMLFAGLPVFFFNKNNFTNHEGLMVLQTFEHDAMQSWYKCMWAEPLPSNGSNASTTATIDAENARRSPMLQDEHAATEWAVCPAAEYGQRIQTNP